MGEIQYIVNKANTRLFGKGRFDPDISVLAFERYIRFLNCIGCADISIVHSKNGVDYINCLSDVAKKS